MAQRMKKATRSSPSNGSKPAIIKRAAHPSKRPTTRKTPASPRPDAETPDNPQEKSRLFPIVGIGASAGGLEAFSQLLERLPDDTGMAFVLVQHLAPAHASMLTELLSKTTTMRAREIRDGMAVEPNNIYIIPPNVTMAIMHGVLHLLPRATTRDVPLPIDTFLSSLADDQGDNAIAIILSGTGSDGSLGVKAIKAEGGIVFSQDEKSAKYDGMPASARLTGCVDFALPPDKIAEELKRISLHPYLRRVGPEKTAAQIPEAETDLAKIFIMLRTATGVDFSNYKPATIKRRILRRMLLQRIEKLDRYIKHLQEKPAEVEALYQDILINVTTFFRDPKTYSALKASVFPLITKKESDIPVRVWVPACSTGEEAYSIAICLLEFLSEKKLSQQIQIFATDIDETAIEKARRGMYPDSIAKDVSPERLRRFFVKTAAGYQISKSIREMCIFARQNLVRDPPFSRIDLISCRNLLIYFGPALQKKALPIMHYALNPGGYLMLGTSEAIGDFSNLFAPVDKKNKVYSKKATLSQLHFGAQEQRDEPKQVTKKRTVPVPASYDIQNEADNIVLRKYGSAGVIINDDMKILNFRGDTGPYLLPSPGEASLDLMKMAREGLTIDLRTVIHKARKENAPARKEGIQFKQNKQFRTINIEVVPFSAPITKECYYLVLFEEAAPKPSPEPKKAQRSAAEKVPGKAQDTEVLQLRHELAATKEYLRTITAEHEAATAESTALNEELQSSNEEMQSINEELETAKEELQSTNEELTTVNDELQSRNIEMSEVSSDVINILSGIEIPVILLGGNLQIRRFNPSAGALLNLIVSDIGRSISDIRSNLNVPDLGRMVHEVMDSLVVKQQEIQDNNGKWNSLTIRPYKTVDNRIDGALIAIVDINDIKLTEKKLRETGAFNQSIIDSSSDCIKILDLEGRLQYMSPGGQQLLEIPDLGKYLSVPYEEFWKGTDHQAALAAISSAREGRPGRFQGYGPTASGAPRWWDVVISPIMGAEGKPERFLAVSRDITERKRAEEERDKIMHDRNEALEHIKKLSGLLPICASCKKIRDDKGAWTQMETYIHEHSEAEFSHGLCPDCYKNELNKVDEMKREK